MFSKLINLDQLVSGPFKVSGNEILKSVLARGTFGDVKVWKSHVMSWSWGPTGVNPHALSNDLFDLIVLGNPKVVGVSLVTDPAFDKGVFSAPISMTLAHGLIWAQQWNQDALSNKTEVLDQLNWMIARVKVNLDYDRYHYASMPILALIIAIDTTIEDTDRTAFSTQIERLFRHDLMSFNPYSCTAGMGSQHKCV